VKSQRGVVCVLGMVAMLADFRPLAAADTDPAAKLAEQRGCLRCHDPARPRFGPSFLAIADRYRSNCDAESRLIDWLGTGGLGHWGNEYEMSGQDHLGASDTLTLVRWILRQ